MFVKLGELSVGDVLVLNTRFSGAYYVFAKVVSLTPTGRPRVVHLVSHVSHSIHTATYACDYVKPLVDLEVSVSRLRTQTLSVDKEGFIKFCSLPVERYDPQREYLNEYHL